MRGSLTWWRHCSGVDNGFPCTWSSSLDLQTLQSHNRSRAGWDRWQKPAAPGSRWRETSGCPEAFDPGISVGDPGESWQWRGRWGAKNWRCLRWRKEPQPLGWGATSPTYPESLSHCTGKTSIKRYQCEHRFKCMNFNWREGGAISSQFSSTMTYLYNAPLCKLRPSEKLWLDTKNSWQNPWGSTSHGYSPEGPHPTSVWSLPRRSLKRTIIKSLLGSKTFHSNP